MSILMIFGIKMPFYVYAGTLKFQTHFFESNSTIWYILIQLFNFNQYIIHSRMYLISELARNNVGSYYTGEQR